VNGQDVTALTGAVKISGTLYRYNSVTKEWNASSKRVEHVCRESETIFLYRILAGKALEKGKSEWLLTVFMILIRTVYMKRFLRKDYFINRLKTKVNLNSTSI
jgi:hypothetical protein